MATIGKEFTFDAAHRLQNHDGKCRNLHGHTYHVEVSIQGPIQDQAQANEDALHFVVGSQGQPVINPQGGMVLDFGRLKDWWKPVEAVLDHKTILQETDPLCDVLTPHTSLTVFPWPPTAENLALWIREDLEGWLLRYVWAGGFATPVVRVYETPTSWAEA